MTHETDSITTAKLKLMNVKTRLLTHPKIHIEPTVVIENVIHAAMDELEQQRKKDGYQR